MHEIKDLTDKTFGRLTALTCVGFNARRKALWRCRCACGNEKTILGASLSFGATRSCGCLMREVAPRNAAHVGVARVGNRLVHPITHGHCVNGLISSTYISWGNMLARCTNPKHNRWSVYGGANPPVLLCERWRTFELFLADMGVRPVGTSLGRFGDVGNYEPGNVAWQTQKQQSLEQKIKKWNKQLAAIAA
jgi:hypothetical protein